MTMSSQDSRHEFDVIFRAYGDRPVRLTAITSYGHRVEVYGTDKEKRIRVCNTDVFRFDPDIFTRLVVAYQSGDARELRSLWETATPVETPVNPFVMAG